MNLSNRNSVISVPEALATAYPWAVWQQNGTSYTSIEHMDLFEDEGLSPPEEILDLFQSTNVVAVYGNAQFTLFEDTTLDVNLLKQDQLFEVLANGQKVSLSVPDGYTIDNAESVSINASEIGKFYKQSDSAIARVADSSATATIVDSQGRRLSPFVLFEGGGINSSSTTGPGKRFNGMTSNNSTGPIAEKGMVLERIECWADNEASGRFLEIYHYSPEGGDGQRVYKKELTKLGGQLLADEDLDIFIPPLRRLVVLLSGSRFRYPQYRLEYRRIL